MLDIDQFEMNIGNSPGDEPCEVPVVDMVGGSLTIVVATYNERQTLPMLVQGIHRHLPGARILVVDDNSPDGTGDWVRQAATVNSTIHLLHRQEKQGLGVATLAGIRHAMEHETDRIATMDADLSHRPGDLARMWKASTESAADVVIGSRYVTDGRIENWSLRRRIASRCVNGFARWLLWLKPRDNSGAFRIYRVAALRKIDLDAVDCRGFVYLEQILVHLQRAGARFHEVPIVFSEREQGDSKVTMGELARNLVDVIRLAIRRIFRQP